MEIQSERRCLRSSAAPVCLTLAGAFGVPVPPELLLQSHSQPLNKQVDLMGLQLLPLLHEPLQEENHSCYFSPHVHKCFITVPKPLEEVNELWSDKIL